MARKRGFFAEMQHQAKVAQKCQEQAARQATRERAAAARHAEQARRAAEQARARAQRTAENERKQADREAKRLHVEARQAEVTAMNAALADTYDDIDLMLLATLDVDDHVDLESLRVRVEHPPFLRADLEEPTPTPESLTGPPEPTYQEPPPPTGVAAAFGGAKRHARAVHLAREAYWAEHRSWQEALAELPARQLAQAREHQRQEAERLEELDRERAAYRAACQAREEEVRARNEPFDALIAGLARNDEQAVQDYVSIVLGNSVYPDAFPVDHEFSFDAALGELDLTALVPGPDEVPSVKAYRYHKGDDEILSTQLAQKDRRERYAGAIHQVALRSLHEVFEADREGRIRTISLTVATETIDPAIGRPVSTPLVRVAADRDRFMEIELQHVVPAATLEHLGAVVSKNPFALAGIGDGQGVRGP